MPRCMIVIQLHISTGANIFVLPVVIFFYFTFCVSQASKSSFSAAYTLYSNFIFILKSYV